MKNLLWLVCLGVVCLAIVSSTVDAQDAELLAPQSDDDFFGPIPDRQSQREHESGYRRYETPRELVFRNAALKAAQRRERMAINARFGYSPSRPPSSTLPFMGSPIGPPTTWRFYTFYPGIIFPGPYRGF